MQRAAYYTLICAVVISTAALPLPAAVGVGDKAPDFSLSSVDSRYSVRLSDHSGSPILLIFWMSNCAHCRAEAPVIQKLYADLNGKGLSVVGLSVDESRSAACDFVKSCKLAFPNAFAGTDRGKEVMAAYGLVHVPMLYVIGKDGKVKAVWSGEAEERAIRGELAKMGVR